MSKQEIDQFLAEKRIGVVGVSRNAGKFSNQVYAKLKESGCELHPVHPSMEALDGDPCVAGISQLPSEVRALLVVASQNVCASVLKDLSGTGITRVWVFSGFKNRPDVEAEIARLRSSGVSVITCFCPFMFLEPVGSIHSIHRFIVRLVGKYPK